MSGDKAIVAVQDGETALAEPKKIALRQKRRCYVTIKSYPGRNSGPHRDQPMLDVSLAERTEDDLSEKALDSLFIPLYDPVWAGFLSGLVFAGLSDDILACTMSHTLYPHDEFIVGCVFAILGGLCGYMVFKYLNQLELRRRDRILAERKTEDRQIVSGIKEIATLASNPHRQEIEIPIESVFLALDHPKEAVRQKAVQLAAGLPGAMVQQGAKRYRKALTVQALCLLPGMGWLQDKRVTDITDMGRNPKLEPFYKKGIIEASEWRLVDKQPEDDEPSSAE